MCALRRGATEMRPGGSTVQILAVGARLELLYSAFIVPGGIAPCAPMRSSKPTWPPLHHSYSISRAPPGGYLTAARAQLTVKRHPCMQQWSDANTLQTLPLQRR